MSEPASTKSFAAGPELYDEMVNWERRLGVETPFYRRLFESNGVKSLLDVACGTGRHAALFNSWGLRVTGADVDPAMIAYCRRRCGQSDGLQWVERSYEQPHDPPAGFDAVVCVGNSLSIVPDLAAVRAVLGAMVASIRAGGVLVVQVLNLWRLPDGPTQWQKCQRMRVSGVDCVVLKGIHRVGSRGYVDFARLDLDNGEVAGHFDGATLLGIEQSELLAAAADVGLDAARVVGDYAETPYSREESQDMILVGNKAG